MNERALHGPTDDKSRNQWSIDTIEIPQTTDEALAADLRYLYSFQALSLALDSIAKERSVNLGNIGAGGCEQAALQEKMVPQGETKSIHEIIFSLLSRVCKTVCKGMKSS